MPITFARFLSTAGLIGVLASWCARPAPALASPELNGCEQQFMRVVDGVRPSVVTVTAYSRVEGEAPNAGRTLKKTVGSGVVINGEGHVLTTISVVGSSRNLFIRDHDGGERPAVFLGADHETGLVLLKVKPEGLAPAQLGRPEDLQPGAWAIIVAESFGQYPRYAFGAFTRVETKGGGPGREPRLLQMSTQVFPGNSGGAVANANGEVVGVVLGANTLGNEPEPDGADAVATGGRAGSNVPPAGSSTLSLAIPIDQAGLVASDLATHGSSGPGFLGVRVRTSTPALKDLLRFESGVVILEVIAMSPAEAAGIEAGDVILKFGGQDVGEPEALARLVAEVRPGERRDVDLLRGDVRLARSVTIVSAPAGGDSRGGETERRELKQRVDELKHELEELEGRIEPR